MKLFKKYWLSALAFVMTLVIGSYYALGGFFSVEKNKVSANVRTVQLSNNEMDYQAILNEFEDSTLTTEGTLTTFTGYQALDASVFEEIDNLSESDVETLDECKVGYKFTYDTESNVVTIYASMENELGEIEMDTISGVGFINEAGEIDAVMNVDGEGVLLSEMRNAGMIQNCGWFSNFIKKAVKIIVPALVVVAVAAVTVAVCVATAGAAAPALVAAGVASSTAVSVGSAAAGATAGAIFYATVGTAAIQAGVEVGEDLSNAIPDTNVGTKSNVKSEDKNNESGEESENEQGVKVPEYPEDPTKAPGEDWEWRGKGEVGSDKGSWYNPNTGESMHPDLNHPEPIGPHWDYTAPDGQVYRIFPDGTFTIGG